MERMAFGLAKEGYTGGSNLSGTSPGERGAGQGPQSYSRGAKVPSTRMGQLQAPEREAWERERVEIPLPAKSLPPLSEI